MKDTRSPRGEVYGRTPSMHGHEESDDGVVPKKSPNNAETSAAEGMEGRPSAKGNPVDGPPPRTQRRNKVVGPATRVREAAKGDGKLRFNALYHHVYAIERLRAAFHALRRDAVSGIDDVTWRAYRENLEDNLQDLSERLKRGAYRAKPVRRAYIPKADKKPRPLGLPSLEDKVVQRAMAEVLGWVYEVDFLGFSYGFRPGRGPHGALDALTVGIETRRINWVLDADIQDFFGTMDHEWMRRFLEHRIADRRVLGLIEQWLTAGVVEDGRWAPVNKGTVQGGSISPLLANIYLHYAFDLWVQQWRRREARGRVIVVRFADDVVLGFEHQWEAESFSRFLRERLSRFGLTLHPEKTRLLEFGRFAASNRKRRGEAKPETFDFLGFTHICGRTRRGRFVVLRRTSARRMREKLAEVREGLAKRAHWRLPDLARYVQAVVRGHQNYFAVPRNGECLRRFRRAVRHLWHMALERRSERTRVPLARLDRLVKRYFPPMRIVHPYPNQRLRVMT